MQFTTSLTARLLPLSIPHGKRRTAIAVILTLLMQQINSRLGCMSGTNYLAAAGIVYAVMICIIIIVGIAEWTDVATFAAATR